MDSYSNPLQELVDKRLKALNISVREAAQRSHGLVSHTNIQRIRSGEHQGKLRDTAVAGLALALDVTRQDIQDAMTETISPLALKDYFGRLQTLSPSRQVEVLDKMRELLDRHEEEQRAARERAR